MRTGSALAGMLLLVALAACSSSELSDEQRGPDTRGAEAIAEVTTLEGTSATAEEHAFVEDLGSMSRPYWDSGPEAMILGYEICVAGTPSAAVFDLVDLDWSKDDAETFVGAAVKNLC